ncbi:MAG: Fe-S cluster assembly protein SufD [Wenzhouxiangellaceae bacterium]
MSTALAEWLESDQPAEQGGVGTALRQRAAAELRQHGYPTLKTEDWKYTGLRRLEARPTPAEAPDIQALERQLASLFPQGLPERCVVFAGAVYIPELSQAAGVTLIQDELLNDRLAGLLDDLGGAEDAFVRLALAQCHQAWRLDCEADDERLLHIVHLPARGGDGAGHLVLNLNLAAGQKLALLEHHDAQPASFNNALWTMDLAESAQLDHGRIIDIGNEAMNFDRCDVNLAAHARYRFGDVIRSGRMVRHEARIHYCGDNAQALTCAALMIDQQCHADHDWLMVHGAHHCNSQQWFRAAVNDRARAIYSGRARIHARIRGSSVEQSSRGLMLSDDAEIDARPILEIYADEVQASHGATTGCLDEDALHYLRSRGIDEAQARNMLIDAFVRSALTPLSDSLLSDALHQALALNQSGDHL